MLQYKTHESPAWEPQIRESGIPKLPVCVRPMSHEAFLSWLMRLASRLGVSIDTLARRGFRVDEHLIESSWWNRPDPWLLARISDQSGVDVASLRRMTTAQWAPVYRDDEANERFTGRRFAARPPARRGRRFVVCGECLDADVIPYLRRSWMLGWMAVCPRHRTLLMVRCGRCRYKLRAAPFHVEACFAPRNCTECGAELGAGSELPGLPSVVRLQEKLLNGKYYGSTEFEGIGRLEWSETVALVDILIGTYWTGTTQEERARIYRQFERENEALSAEESSAYECRYGALVFLAWLTDGWPVSAGAAVGKQLLGRWFTCKTDRISHHLSTTRIDPCQVNVERIDRSIRGRLFELLAADRIVSRRRFAERPPL